MIRHFNLVWVPDLPEASMKTIFEAVLGGFLTISGFDASINALNEAIVAATSLYTRWLRLPSAWICSWTSSQIAPYAIRCGRVPASQGGGWRRRHAIHRIRESQQFPISNPTLEKGVMLRFALCVRNIHQGQSVQS